MKMAPRMKYTEDEALLLQNLVGVMCVSELFVNTNARHTTDGKFTTSFFKELHHIEFDEHGLNDMLALLTDVVERLYKETFYSHWRATFPNKQLVPDSTIDGLCNMRIFQRDRIKELVKTTADGLESLRQQKTNQTEEE